MHITKIHLKRNEKSITVEELADRVSANWRAPSIDYDSRRLLFNYVTDLDRRDASRKALLDRIAGEFSAMLGKPVDATTTFTLEELASWYSLRDDVDIEQDRLSPHVQSYYEVALDRILVAAAASSDNVAPQAGGDEHRAATDDATCTDGRGAPSSIAASNAVVLPSEHGIVRAPSDEAAPPACDVQQVATATNAPISEQGAVPRLSITPNSKADIDAYIVYRAREIHRDGEATSNGGIANIIAAEMKDKGYRSERKYLSAATVVKAIPAGLTGGRANNGRKSKRN